MDFLENFDKQRLQRITLIVIAALTLLALILLLVIIISSVEGNIGAGGIFGNTENIEFESKPVTENQLVTGSLVLADDSHPYVVDESALALIGCQSYRNEHRTTEKGPYYAGNHMLTSEAMAAAHNMLTDAESAVGDDDLMIWYAYGQDDGITVEYKTAQLIYLSAYEGKPLTEDYSSWLEANAVKYGFVKKLENGYRYVGTVHAKYMDDNNMNLEEYIEYLKDKTSHTSPLSVKINKSVYYVYYESAVAGDNINVPVQTENSDGSMSYDYTISGTNEGGVIITVKVK